MRALFSLEDQSALACMLFAMKPKRARLLDVALSASCSQLLNHVLHTKLITLSTRRDARALSQSLIPCKSCDAVWCCLTLLPYIGALEAGFTFLKELVGSLEQGHAPRVLQAPPAAARVKPPRQ